jgi:putative copper resistance protein D
MSDGPLAWEGLTGEIALAFVYVSAARRPSRRGNRWPRNRTACFLLGLAVIALALQSGLAAYDETFWVHNVQHMLLMMVAPPLLALGAPVTLALRTSSGPGRRRILSWLHDPSVRRVMTRPAMLVADYSLAMAVYLLTPLYRWSLHNEWLHIWTHVYFLVCGLLFWIPIAAADPVPGRMALRTRAFLVALGIPINAALAVLLLLHLAPAGDATASATAVGALTLIIASTVATAAGVVAILARAPARTRTRTNAHRTRAPELTWVGLVSPERARR